MLSRFLLFFCLSSPMWAKTPRPVPEIPIQTLTGQRIYLKQYHAKAMVLVVFSVGCGDCVTTLQLLDRMQKDYQGYGFQAVAVAGDVDANIKLASFIQRYRPSIPVGYMDQDNIAKLCDVTKEQHPFVPIVLFIDQTGQVRFQYNGDNAFFRQQDHGMRALTEGLLQQAGAKIQFGQAGKK